MGTVLKISVSNYSLFVFFFSFGLFSRYLNTKLLKFIDTFFISFLTAALGISSMHLLRNCRGIKPNVYDPVHKLQVYDSVTNFRCNVYSKLLPSHYVCITCTYIDGIFYRCFAKMASTTK